MTTAPTPSSRASGTAPVPVCPACANEMVEINLLIDGEALSMRSCATCDTRSWHRGESQVDLGGVLADLSSSPTRYRRDLASR